MNLGIEGFTWQDLHDLSRLNDLAVAFDRYVESHDPELFKRFEAYRRDPGLPAPEESALLIAVGRYLSMFVTRLFHIEPAKVELVVRTAIRSRADSLPDPHPKAVEHCRKEVRRELIRLVASAMLQTGL